MLPTPPAPPQPVAPPPPGWAAPSPPSSWGAYPPPPPPPAPPVGPRRLRAIAIATLALVVIASAAVVIAVRDASSTQHPETWDARVLDIVRFAERHRGLEFKHPVYVDFLTAEQYSERTRTDAAVLSEEEQQAYADAEGELRAFGLVAGDTSLLDVSNDLQDTGTLAFYDPHAKRITVRGTEMAVDVRVTLVHELVHVLQDQHFDINKTRDEFLTSGEGQAFRALAEGDAVRIEDQYVDQLSDTDRAEYDSTRDQSFTEVKTDLAHVPSALQAFQAAPYELGPVLLALLASKGGNAAIDEAFLDPPSTEAQLLDPRAYFAHRDALEVSEPLAPDDVADPTDSGDLGALTWYLVLAQRIDPFEALAASDGWGGDAYIAYRQSDRTCVRAAFRGVDDRATDVMRTALHTWSAAGPAGTSTVVDTGEGVEVTSCDPGADASVNDSQRALQAFLIPDLRVQWMQAAVEGGGYDLEKGWSYGDCMIRQLTFEQYGVLNESPSADALPDDLRATLDQAQSDCIAQVA